MSEPVNFKHLYYFWTVAHQGSIAKASQALHITPQTISGQLSLLEQRFNNKLFARVGRRLELTETGRIILRYADDIFDLGNELSSVLRGLPSGRQTRLVVSAVSGLPKTIVYKIIEPALQTPDGINLVCEEGPLKGILANLAIHKVDLVLSDSPATEDLSINVYNHFLGESSLSFFTEKKLAKRYTKSFPQSMNLAPFLYPTKQHQVRQLVEHWLNDKNIYPDIRGEFDDSALLKSFGSTGLGIFFMPTVIEDEVKKAFNVEVIGRTDEIKQRFYAISAERKIKNIAVNKILEKAKQALF